MRLRVVVMGVRVEARFKRLVRERPRNHGAADAGKARVNAAVVVMMRPAHRRPCRMKARRELLQRRLHRRMKAESIDDRRAHGVTLGRRRRVRVNRLLGLQARLQRRVERHRYRLTRSNQALHVLSCL